MPIDGGGRDRYQFINQYTWMLASYRRMFGEEPPKDIWPTPEERFSSTQKFQRVDMREYRKKEWSAPQGLGLFFGLFSMAALITQSWGYAVMIALVVVVIVDRITFGALGNGRADNSCGSGGGCGGGCGG